MTPTSIFILSLIMFAAGALARPYIVAAIQWFTNDPNWPRHVAQGLAAGSLYPSVISPSLYQRQVQPEQVAEAEKRNIVDAVRYALKTRLTKSELTPEQVQLLRMLGVLIDDASDHERMYLVHLTDAQYQLLQPLEWIARLEPEQVIAVTCS